MVYLDKPKPSNGYVSFLIILETSFIVIFLAHISFLGHSTFWGEDLRVFIIPLIYFLLLIFLFGLCIHAAYNTEYRIENGKLWMKIGYINKGSVSLDEIKSIEKVEFIRGKTWSYFANRYYRNRFKNGIRVITEKRIILVSPEDIERFVSELGFY